MRLNESVRCATVRPEGQGDNGTSAVEDEADMDGDEGSVNDTGKGVDCSGG